MLKNKSINRSVCNLHHHRYHLLLHTVPKQHHYTKLERLPTAHDLSPLDTFLCGGGRRPEVRNCNQLFNKHNISVAPRPADLSIVHSRIITLVQWLSRYVIDLCCFDTSTRETFRHMNKRWSGSRVSWLAWRTTLPLHSGAVWELVPRHPGIFRTRRFRSYTCGSPLLCGLFVEQNKRDISFHREMRTYSLPLFGFPDIRTPWKKQRSYYKSCLLKVLSRPFRPSLAVEYELFT